MDKTTLRYVLIGVLIAACVLLPVLKRTQRSTRPGDGQTVVKIVYWDWFGSGYSKFVKEEIRLFEKAHPSIRVEFVQIPDQQRYREAVGLAFASSTPPDVFRKPIGISFAQMVEQGWARPLDRFITPKWKSTFPDGSFVESKNTWQGKVYTFPIYAQTSDRVMYINNSLFRQAGLVGRNKAIRVPRTWSELRDCARTITKAGNGEFYGIGIGMRDSRAAAWWFDLAGLAGAPGMSSNVDYRTGKYRFGSDPAYGEVVELILGMKRDGSVMPAEGGYDDSNLYIPLRAG